MRSSVVVEVLESADDGAEVLERGGQFVDFVEFTSPGFLDAFDSAIELGAAGREDEEFDAAVAAGGLEGGHEFATAIDLDGADVERAVLEDLVEEACGVGGGGAGVDLPDGPARDRADSREVLEPAPGLDTQVQRVDLEPVSGPGGSWDVLWQPAGVVAAHPAGSAEALTSSVSPQHDAAVHEVAQNPADRRFRHLEALVME
jgi:hypothetical protein